MPALVAGLEPCLVRTSTISLAVRLMQKRILIADDHVDAADSTGALLSLDGRFEVRVVYDGLQAVEIGRIFEPDLVLLDINMPGMDGYEAARIMRSEQPPNRRLVLVALTGRTSQEDVDRACGCGFDLHLSKPVALGALNHLVASILESNRV